MAKQNNMLLNIGYNNSVVSSRVVAIVGPGSSPMRRLREVARHDGRIIDATKGIKTGSFIITDSNHCILSAVQPETIAQRLEENKND